MQEWQLVIAVLVAVVSIASMVFGVYKFIDGKIQNHATQLRSEIHDESKAREVEDARIHDRINHVKENTPRHDDIKRVEGYLERISERLDKLVAMVVDYGHRSRDDHK